METQDLLQPSAVNSSLPILGQQQGNSFTDDPLQLPLARLNQWGSFTEPMRVGMNDSAIAEVEFAEAFEESFGSSGFFEVSTPTSQLPAVSDSAVDPFSPSTPAREWSDSLLAQPTLDLLVSSQAQHEQILGLFTGITGVALEIADSSPQLQEPVLGVLGGMTEVAREIVEYNQSLLELLGESALDEGTSSEEGVLALALTSAQEQLGEFATEENFLDQMQQAFGQDWRPQGARALIYNLASGREELNIEQLPAADLNSANGAFVEDTIYLAEEFLRENAANPEAVATVLLEEIGHYVDRELSRVDSSGDEGKIFAKLVEGETLDGDELAALKTEDDRATIYLNGEEVPVELAAPPYPGYSLDYVEGETQVYDANAELWQQRMAELGYSLDVDGYYGPESEAVCIEFQGDQGLAVDGIVGPDTWEASFAADEVAEPPSGSSFIDNVVAIAYQEWELFAQGAIEETDEGAWQRVGDYWQSVGLDYTGLDTDQPWSAAFISWVMQESGAGDSFEYNASHSYYIEDAIEDRNENDTAASFFGYTLDEYSPEVGDLVGYARQEGVGYDTPAPYESHTDIVVAKREGEIDVIGGNVGDSVTLKTLAIDSEGRLIDTSEDWFVVLSNQNPAIA